MSGLVPAHTNGLYRGPGMEAHVYRWLAGIINHEGVNTQSRGWVAGLWWKLHYMPGTQPHFLNKQYANNNN